MGCLQDYIIVGDNIILAIYKEYDAIHVFIRLCQNKLQTNLFLFFFSFIKENIFLGWLCLDPNHN